MDFFKYTFLSHAKSSYEKDLEDGTIDVNIFHFLSNPKMVMLLDDMSTKHFNIAQVIIFASLHIESAYRVLGWSE